MMDEAAPLWRPSPVINNRHGAMDNTLCSLERVRTVFRRATSDLMDDVVNADGFEVAKRHGLDIWMILVAAEDLLQIVEADFHAINEASRNEQRGSAK